MYSFLTTLICLIALIIVLIFKRMCKHNYEFIKEVEIYTTQAYSGKKLPKGISRIYECTKCKKIKKHEL